MLTKSEKQWLEQRDAIQFMCDQYRVPGTQDGYRIRKMQTADWREAAEFEARVAAKLADIVFCTFRNINGLRFECLPEIRLKIARIVVEKEMENEMDK